MPSRIECENHHRASIRIQDAAIALSRSREGLGKCRTCGKSFQWIVELRHANDSNVGQLHRHNVEGTVRLGTRLADAEGYDPFLILLRKAEGPEAGREELWPIFWAPGRKHRSLYGQFAPMLTREEWRRLFQALDPDFFR